MAAKASLPPTAVAHVPGSREYKTLQILHSEPTLRLGTSTFLRPGGRHSHRLPGLRMYGTGMALGSHQLVGAG